MTDAEKERRLGVVKTSYDPMIGRARLDSVRGVETVYCLLLGLFWFATALPLPLMVLLAQARGLDLFQIGGMRAVYSLTVVLLEIPTGGLADAVGRRRVASLAYAVTLASAVVFLFSFRMPMFVLYAVLSGIGRALASGALDAWFIDRLQSIEPAIDLHPRFARSGAVALFALGAGTVLGGFLGSRFSSLPADGAAVLSPMSVPVLVSIGLWALLFFLTRVLVRESVSPANKQQGWLRSVAGVPALVKDAAAMMAGNRSLVRLLAVAGVSGLVLSGIELLWQPHFRPLLGEASSLGFHLGWIMAGSFLAGMAGNLLSPWLSRLFRGRHGWSCAVQHALRGLFLVLLALQTGPVPAVLLFWMVYGGQGAIGTTHRLLLNEQIPAERRSAMLSIESFVAYLGGFVASLGLGWIAEQGSTSLALILSGATLLVSWGLYVGVDARRKERTHDGIILAEQADQT